MYSYNVISAIKAYLSSRFKNRQIHHLFNALFEPVRSFVIDYKKSVEFMFDRTKFNGQVISLETFLNDYFECTGIYIEDAVKIDKKYLHNASENRPALYIYNDSESQSPYYLYNQSEFDSQVDFIVQVPAAIYQTLLANNNQKLIQMKGIVDYYRIAPKKYKIVEY
jgi:hypothetical protein